MNQRVKFDVNPKPLNFEPVNGYLNHFLYSSAGGAIRANIFDHPDSNCAPIILQEQRLPGVELFLDLYKSAAQAMGG
jgi:hypothetical protein